MAAQQAYRQALDFGGPQLDSYCNLSAVSVALGAWSEAEACARRALQLAPDDADAWNALGAARLGIGALKDAEAAFARAVTYDPDHGDAWANRSGALNALCRRQEAVAAADRAFSLEPNNPRAIEAALRFKLNTCAWDGMDAVVEAADAAIQAGVPIAPFAMLSICVDPAVLKRLGTIQAHAFARAVAGAPAWSGRGVRANRPLRVGFCSVHLRRNVVGYLVAEMTARRDRHDVAYVAALLSYSERPEGDALFDEGFDEVVPLGGRSLLEQIDGLRALDLDIAVDLDGYAGDGRPTPLAARVAPVQLRWIDYAATSGAPYLDYFVTDPQVTPASRAEDYSEALLRLPRIWLPNDSRRRPTGPAPSRAEVGLPDQAFVFCAFNQTMKITPPIVAAWAAILRATPGSVLWLLEAHDVANRNLITAFARHGVASDRLVFAPRTDPAAYLSRFLLADLALDTYPYNGHSVTADALFMGLPVLTLRGSATAARMAASFLEVLGLQELIAEDVRDYGRRAVALARDHERLTSLRERLGSATRATRLFDGEAFARDFERGLLMVAERARAGLPPATINVPAG